VTVVTDVHSEEHHEHIDARHYHDKTAAKSLVHFLEHHRRYGHMGAHLTDYTKKFEWRWEVHNNTVHDCVLSEHDRPMEQYCVAKAANLTGSGFIGEHDAFESYVAAIHRPGYWSESHVLMEKGSKEAALRKSERGEGHHHRYFETVDYYDYNTAPIDPQTQSI
jgi:hypothetical protein